MAEWVEYGSRCYYRPDREFSNGPRLLIREITGETLVCAYSDAEHMPNKAVIVFRSDEVDLKYVLGLLNSRLVGRYVSETTEKGTQRLFPRISLRSFRNLPMPVIDLSRSPDRARHDKMVSLVDKMLALVPKLRAAKSEQERKTLQNAVDATDRQIDELVYELYGLTKDEIALVERESK
jgi:Xaa-Pro aminopeptidase